jgi:perosamine synthetase
MSDPIPFHKPDIDSDDRKALRDVLTSGWLTTGKEAAALEREFAESVGARCAVAVSSGTAALHVACVLAGFNHPTHEVIVPTLTFTSTASEVLHAGATPVLADVDAETFNLSVETVAARRTRKTVGVLPVHYTGSPQGLPAIVKDAQEQSPRYTVIEDAAPAYLAAINGTMIGGPTGSFARCFSLRVTKNVTAVEGGMLTFDDIQLERPARRYAYHGINPDTRPPGVTEVVVDIGWKYNLPDLLAALGRSQLRKADVLAGRRQTIADRYRMQFSSLVDAGLLRVPRVDPTVTSSWQLYIVRFALERLRPEWTRDRLGQTLRERGIGTSLQTLQRPLHTHPFWRERGGSAKWGEFPVADKIASSGLCLPIWPGMAEAQVDQVADEVSRLVKAAVR